MNAGDCCPMQRAWGTLLAQARTNHKTQENIADLIQVQREVVQPPSGAPFGCLSTVRGDLCAMSRK